jgi:glycosyltransferase involved in cell wall biosynthesis
MRVLIFITRGEPGGAQIHVLSLVRGLISDIEVAVGVGDDDDYLAGELTAAGVPVHVLPELQRSISPRIDRRALAAMRRLIRAFRPDIVHTHSSKAGLLGRLAARLEGVPAIHTAHAWSFSDGLPWKRKALAIPPEALAGRITRRFIVVSGADREIAMRYRVGRDSQIRIVHNGVVDVLQRADPAGGDPPVIAMVARMAPPKDHDLLLRALSGVTAPFRLQLIGGGPDEDAVRAQLHRLGLTDKTELLGVRRDVPELLAGAQVCVLISRQEGFPLAILEGMRAGLPVIASDVGGVREAITHGRTGLLIARGDEAALRDALQLLLSEPDRRAAMGAAGRATFEERFTVTRMIQRTREVYLEIAREDRIPT